MLRWRGEERIPLGDSKQGIFVLVNSINYLCGASPKRILEPLLEPVRLLHYTSIWLYYTQVFNMIFSFACNSDHTLSFHILQGTEFSFFLFKYWFTFSGVLNECKTTSSIVTIKPFHFKVFNLHHQTSFMNLNR